MNTKPVLIMFLLIPLYTSASEISVKPSEIPVLFSSKIDIPDAALNVSSLSFYCGTYNSAGISFSGKVINGNHITNINNMKCVGWEANYDIGIAQNHTPLEVSGYLRNDTDSTREVAFLVHDLDITGPIYTQRISPFIEVPSTITCSVNMADSLAFNHLIAGETSMPIQLTSNFTGSGNITFKPDAHDNVGGLIKNENGKTLSYSVFGSSSTTEWNAADGQWRGNLTNDYALQIGAIPASVEPGTYKGTMTATISCH